MEVTCVAWWWCCTDCTAGSRMRRKLGKLEKLRPFLGETRSIYLSPSPSICNSLWFRGGEISCPSDAGRKSKTRQCADIMGIRVEGGHESTCVSTLITLLHVSVWIGPWGLDNRSHLHQRPEFCLASP